MAGTFTPKTLIANFLTTSAAAVITGETGKVKKIVSIELDSKHTALVDVNIWVAPNNGGSARTVSADDMYQKRPISLAANDSVDMLAKWVLGAANDTIQMKASTASVVSVKINYIEET